MASDGDEAVDIEDLHAAAVAAGDDTYIDPGTGYQVFTEVGLRKLGKCCMCGCRHCPYKGAAPPSEEDLKPELLNKGPKIKKKVTVLFWSSGKDSFLAYRALHIHGDKEVALLTTFDAVSRRVGHQEVGISQVKKQAEYLEAWAVGVPLPRGTTTAYVDLVKQGIRVLEQFVTVEALAFGDLHLEDIKAWRDEALTPLGYPLVYPIFAAKPQSNYEALIQDLDDAGAWVVVSASTVDPRIAVKGDVFDRDMYDRLKADHPDVDPFGENGEFHTLACFLPKTLPDPPSEKKSKEMKSSSSSEKKEKNDDDDVTVATADDDDATVATVDHQKSHSQKKTTSSSSSSSSIRTTTASKDTSRVNKKKK